MRNLVTAIFALALLRTASTSRCSKANRNNNLAACLADIVTVSQDNERFWFGSSYNQRCPDGSKPSEPDCTILAGFQIPQSIASLAFPNGNFDSSKVDRYLDVKYTSNPGGYSGCDNSYVFENTFRFTADPLSMTTVNCWDVRDLPEVTWTYETGQLYALVILDVGHQVLHAAYMNILGNDIANADNVQDYNGPGNPFRFGNVYVFFLFQQSARIETDARFTPGLGQFYLSEFKSSLENITDLKAINWILATGDPYSAGIQRGSGLLDNCPSFIVDTIVEPPRPFIPREPKLEVGVQVLYRSSEFSFISCCTHHRLPATNTTLNPLGRGIVKPGEVRVSPQIKLTRTIAFFNSTTGFTGKIYTLIMVDPDIVNPEFATSEKPFVHWLVTNIINGDVTSGDEALSYMGPGPFNDAEHYYYFLVYEQSGTIKPTAPVVYTSDACSGVDANRCIFDITKYVSLNNLKLVGASWLVSRKDEFVRYLRVTAGGSESVVCEGVLGYATGCPHDHVSGSTSLRLPILTLFLTFILGLLTQMCIPAQCPTLSIQHSVSIT